MKKRAPVCSVILSLAITPMAFSAGSPLQSYEQPEVRRAVAPEVPRIVFEARITGTVVVTLSINSKGSVKTAQVIEGHPLLREATRRAALQWRFAPAANETQSVRMTFAFQTIADAEMPVEVSLYNIRLFAKNRSEAIEPLTRDIRLLVKPQKHSDVESFLPEDFEEGITRCKVHDRLLRKDKVRIVYGLIGFVDRYLENREKFFPNSNTIAFGGCVVSEESPSYAEVAYCQVCRKAEAQWHKTHKTGSRFE
jgi:TonB family protein